MQFLQTLLENTQIPILSAFILGLMTAISPCPLATNITAIGYLSKDISQQRRVFYNGLIYTLGRGLSYTILGVIFFLGASQFEVSAFFQTWGEKILGPLLILVGLFMIGLIRLKMPVIERLAGKIEIKNPSGFWKVLLLGIVFALAFCPYSGVLYFGILIPMTISSASGLYYPLIFALATGIPVIILTWVLAYSVKSVGSLYNKIKLFEMWFF